MRHAIKTLCILLSMAAALLLQAADWYTIDAANQRVDNGIIRYEYVNGPEVNGGRNWYGTGIGDLFDKRNNFQYLNPKSTEKGWGRLDGCGTGYAKWDASSAKFDKVEDKGDHVEITVSAGSRKKLERIYKGSPVIEIHHLNISCSWIDDALVCPGTDLTFCSYGMDDIDPGEYSALRSKCPDNLPRINYLANVNGSSATAVEYKKHYIYGIVDRKTGHGLCVVLPVDIGSPPKIFWNKSSGLHFINTEIFRAKAGKTRWIFPLRGGKEDMLTTGKALVDNGGVTPGTTSAYQRALPQRSDMKFNIRLDGSSIAIEGDNLSNHAVVVRNMKGMLVSRTAIAGGKEYRMPAPSRGMYLVSVARGQSPVAHKILIVQ